MAPPRCPRSWPSLMEELVERILLRIPSDEPKHLFRAALVCKPWRRVLTDPGFLRRYRAFHRAPPLLGYLYNLKGIINLAGIPPLAPTFAPSPLSATPTRPEFMECARTHMVLDCRHGRVLIHRHDLEPKHLVVWNPITGSQNKLSLPIYGHESFAAAVLCAVNGCDHLDCRDGPFLVVFAGAHDEDEGYDFVDDQGYDFEQTWVSIYSSETDRWSALVSIHDCCFLVTKPTLLIGDTLYFVAEKNILKFDIAAHELSVIESPEEYSIEAIPMEVDGGGLGFVYVYGDIIYMLSWQDDANDDGTGEWALNQVMEIKTLLPTDRLFSYYYQLVGLLEGTNTVFISIPQGLFTLDLKSSKVKKVGETGAYYAILPYTGFYTPDLVMGTCHHLQEDAMIDPPT